MLIRSQDKKKLCKLGTFEILKKIKTNVKREREVVGFYILTGDKEEALIIGEYSTEEKAIKVLDMIESFYSNLHYSSFLGSDKCEFFDSIFQMPQDEEVKV